MVDLPSLVYSKWTAESTYPFSLPSRGDCPSDDKELKWYRMFTSMTLNLHFIDRFMVRFKGLSPNQTY